MAVIEFWSTEDYLGKDPKGCPHPIQITIEGELFGTSSTLRDSGLPARDDGNIIAYLESGAWQLASTKERFSNWKIS